jgi:hypothetical protein
VWIRREACLESVRRDYKAVELPLEEILINLI